MAPRKAPSERCEHGAALGAPKASYTEGSASRLWRQRQAQICTLLSLLTFPFLFTPTNFRGDLT